MPSGNLSPIRVRRPVCQTSESTGIDGSLQIRVDCRPIHEREITLRDEFVEEEPHHCRLRVWPWFRRQGSSGRSTGNTAGTGRARSASSADDIGALVSEHEIRDIAIPSACFVQTYAAGACWASQIAKLLCFSENGTVNSTSHAGPQLILPTILATRRWFTLIHHPRYRRELRRMRASSGRIGGCTDERSVTVCSKRHGRETYTAAKRFFLRIYCINYAGARDVFFLAASCPLPR